MALLLLLVTGAQAFIQDGRLAFHSYSEYADDNKDEYFALDGEIFVFDLETSLIYSRAGETIAAAVQHAMNPKFSPDGSRLVFMGLPRDKEYSHNDDLWRNYLDIFLYEFQRDRVLNISAAANLSLFGQIEEDPDFSLDGNSVVFKRNHADLWLMDVGTGNLAQVTDTPQREESGPRFSPDGNWLVFWLDKDGAASIARLLLASGNVEVLIDTPQIQDMYPAYLSNETLLFTRWDDPVGKRDRIYCLDLVGGESHLAAFSSSDGINDSDPFAVRGEIVGFSSTLSGRGDYDLFFGDLITGEIHWLSEANTVKKDLGGSYSSIRVDHVLPPVIAPTMDQSTAEFVAYTGPRPQLATGEEPVTWSLMTAPTGMQIDPQTGIVTWPRPLSDGSPHGITIQVANAGGEDDTTWNLTVNPNQAPAVDIDSPGQDDSVPFAHIGQAVQGLADDPEKALEEVVYRVDGGQWYRATGLVQWHFNIDLGVGENRIEVKALDIHGEESPMVGLTITRRENSFPHGTEALPANHPFLASDQEVGVRVAEGALQGAAIVYAGSEAVFPCFGQNEELPAFDVADTEAVGAPVTIHPLITFGQSVRVFLPCPQAAAPETLSIYGYDGETWTLAMKADGSLTADGQAWILPGSRLDHPELGLIEIAMLRSTSIQAALRYRPVIHVPNRRYDLGSVIVGQSTDTSIGIQNAGTRELRLDRLLLSDEEHFILTSKPQQAVTIPPYQTQTLTITFGPKSKGIHEAVLFIQSNDEENASVEISLTGKGSTAPLASSGGGGCFIDTVMGR